MLRPVADLLAECGRCNLTICDTEEFGLFVTFELSNFTAVAHLLPELHDRGDDVIAFRREHHLDYDLPKARN